MKYCHTQETHTKAAMQKYIAATAATGAVAEAVN